MADPLSRSDYVFLQGFLRDRLGHELGEGKEYLVESRLGAIAPGLGLRGVGPLIDRLRHAPEPGMREAVCEAMVTCETTFFRNTSAFARLRDGVLPALVRARAVERKLRIWCAGCSTGQEPYSLAVTLLDGVPEARGWDIRIVATDVSAAVLRQAEAGVFSANEVRRGLPDGLLRSYFLPTGARWVVSPEVRRLVRFEHLNLVDPAPFTAEFDLILIRNVLIYFTAEARARAFETLRRAIRDDGYLFLGESETILGQSDDFIFAEGEMDSYRPAPPGRTKSGEIRRTGWEF